MVGDNRGVFTRAQAGVLIGVTMRVMGVIDKNRVMRVTMSITPITLTVTPITLKNSHA